MCIATPQRIEAIDGGMARLAGGGHAGLALLPDVRTGDYVIVQSGFATQRMDAGEAGRVLALLAQAGLRGAGHE